MDSPDLIDAQCRSFAPPPLQMLPVTLGNPLKVACDAHLSTSTLPAANCGINRHQNALTIKQEPAKHLTRQCQRQKRAQQYRAIKTAKQKKQQKGPG